MFQMFMHHMVTAWQALISCALLDQLMLYCQLSFEMWYAPDEARPVTTVADKSPA